MSNKLNIFLIIFFLVSCARQENSISISNVKINNKMISIDFNNKSKNNYYIISPQLQLCIDDYYYYGKLSEESTVKKVDSVIADIYKPPVNNNLYIVFIPANSSKKINFQFAEKIEKEAKISIDFPFNYKKDSRLKKLEYELNKLKIKGYYFYSDSIVYSNRIFNQ